MLRGGVFLIVEAEPRAGGLGAESRSWFSCRYRERGRTAVMSLPASWGSHVPRVWLLEYESPDAKRFGWGQTRGKTRSLELGRRITA